MASNDDVNSTLQGIARQLGRIAGGAASTTPSPVSTPVNSLNTVGTTVISTSSVRQAIIFHNPGTTNLYVYPSLTSSAPTTTAPGGSFLIFPGGTLSLSNEEFSNINCGWSAFSGTGSNQALTVVEFF